MVYRGGLGRYGDFGYHRRLTALLETFPRLKGRDDMKAAKNHRFETIADLLRDLGGISARRVRADPLPGTATEKDLIAVNEHSNRLFELVNGVLVEKVVGYAESF